MNRCEIGDCRAILPTLPSGTFQTCVTSPPYFGLRDYGTARWEGGDPECDHIQTRNLKRDTNGGMLPAGQGTRGTQSSTASSAIGYRERCGKCGATRHDSQIGLEPTPDAYVAEMVAVFREVRRVLRDDGTLWLNLGDSYTPNQPNKGQVVQTLRGGATLRSADSDPASGKHAHLNGTATRPPVAPGYKAKDLMGIPWMVAFALRSDGWYLRSDIIWSKPNPMPESVTDRPTKAHEYLFLLSKSGRYYYDAGAIAEPFADERMGNPGGGGHYARQAFAYAGTNAQSGLQKGEWNVDGLRATRNRRSVWTISTTPYSGAHFAVMPEKLIEPCVLAGCPEGGVVLDPFFGSGTVGAVAERLGRRWFGCELNPDYKPLINQRTAQVGIQFTEGK